MNIRVTITSVDNLAGRSRTYKTKEGALKWIKLYLGDNFVPDYPGPKTSDDGINVVYLDGITWPELYDVEPVRLEPAEPYYKYYKDKKFVCDQCGGDGSVDVSAEEEYAGARMSCYRCQETGYVNYEIIYPPGYFDKKEKMVDLVASKPDIDPDYEMKNEEIPF